ncbi:HAD family hydrolase [Marivivens niveibacter]|uniref:HAD family hydrolase n=1 Tax=Marivivens niveibacter TaxID=1930667 RepID=A0A251X0M4_9RHOB|nr:HAD family hydrolase [Marivivens niveibacter]OUD10136.1 HAD family hydrolase [Marivivens niveibacter]
MPQRWTIAFDADDTLWHNETFFQLTQDRFFELLVDHADPQTLEAQLFAAEERNIKFYGYGVKGFTLSMIETALEVTNNKVPQTVIRELVDMGRDMLDHPVELLPHVRDVIETLSEDAKIALITKGDLLHQENKLAQSGLGDFFDVVEIVSDKTATVYQRIFAQFDTARVMMVGNSLRSDVIPAIDAGAWGVHVPFETTWAHELAQEPDHPRFYKIESLGQLPELIASLH